MSSLYNSIQKEKTVYKALEELDYRLSKMKVAPFELNVIGGFAMLLENIRYSDYTDIDYIGSDLNDNIKEIINEVGVEYGLGRGWINNDCLLAGNTLEGLEFATGKLHFKHALDLRIITINSLCKGDLIRMKIIAIDTSFSSVEFGGEFTRIKDFPDIKLLMEASNLSYNDMVKETFDYVMYPEIFYLINYYLKTNDLASLSNNKTMLEIIKNKGKIFN